MKLNPALKVLRFINVLEPDVGYPVLSISKIAMWATLALTAWMVTAHPDDPGGLGAALVANVAAFGNYSFRRHVQFKAGRGSYADLKGSGDVDNPDD